MTSSATQAPFDDIRALLQSVPGPDADAVAAVRAREAVLTKPLGSLGRLEEIAEWLAAWQRREMPKVDIVRVAIFAGNHGVAARGVSAYPPEVTKQMVANFTNGGAAINQMCASQDFSLRVYELALDHPTGDITETDALGERDCAATIAYGMEAIDGDIDLLCIGEMGIANTAVAAAIAHSLYGGAPEDWVGPGTGVVGPGLQAKIAAVDAAAKRMKAEGVTDGLEILRRVGGREIAGMAGAILAGRHHRVPVVVDGFVATSAACALHAVNPDAIAHCIFSHRSAEPAHTRMLECLGQTALLDLGLRLGEGTGAALAAGIIRVAAATHSGMATFEEAGVAAKSQD
ncbi:nicotinate-nucleotide--dimethylbenzimidazole phosphoribosyltransferase [Rhodobium gokarnense]|uniref:Nicotinate-nucleotide--dimethylbenzimidazole phosphoribosyltransferase n=1 Tax=Rhodobium gokarnense TaxID=364296 RepID=A0ABT3HB55_9HYPH|nr:nicotinate-nucleotide--dimethylbenzimidazole phosphoribosyltransferase [Rhodobium gokarnense]MCW2307627.1 nicotinate-nucleotide--dimethylbenzimidazole phosphoribosyltransferase [Rhodobium gokarnense]